MLFFSYANLTYAIIFVDNVFGPRYSARAVRFPLAFTVTVTTSGPAHSLRPTGKPHLATSIACFVGDRNALTALACIGSFQARSSMPGSATRCRDCNDLPCCGGSIRFGGLRRRQPTVRRGTGSSPSTVVTPQGTSNLTVTPSATSGSGVPLQLTPIRVTLTVN